MGFGGIGIWQLLIILAIVVLLFGTKRLSSIGTDLGKAIKGFKKSVKDDDAEASTESDDGEDSNAKRNVEDKTEGTEKQSEKASADDKTRH
ncbi:twin-arginine translocase TatA/TatE family subunit [Marinimicrobium agarilyticum]|uniref:twin-arginine translocase TatA/TatE family subunit n=1 Tax=Marinimicrobium agarilyticum TaxID=306546 RepID=UPI00040F9425|nr:twin-arginine translocase TatA/TatE family subunit [Marinimicrobium agarilyticum]